MRHLLDMTAGTGSPRTTTIPASDVRAYETAAGWRPAAGRRGDLDLLGYIARAAEPARAHGELFEYRSILSDLSGVVLERAAGDRFADAIEPPVWAQLGAEDDAEVTVDRHGNPMTDGGFSVTLRDLRASDSCTCRAGCILGRQVVPPSGWPTRATPTRTAGARSWPRRRRPSLVRPGPAGLLPKGHYRNQWWVLDPAGA